ncbi:MAG TPA: hypothetical protein PK512_00075 [bacterium]|jgi:L-threonine kinase|nr:hypothetical protein [Dictyoglomota bacterium]HHV81308.1 hypothetical protein [bacterium]HOK29166.1 hypothetical protein [bacterium]HOL54781.1 hypothetical protein [bacterium]HON71708.1 hypothetical protein [bacterium]
MERVKVYCPGSCGELIQGVIYGRELLISYPIELGTVVSIEISEKKDTEKLTPKIESAAEKTLEFLGIPKRFLENIKIRKTSSLPLGKGMSSSTADIASVIFGIGVLFGIELDSHKIAKISVSIEPTDSIIFEDITLFDSLRGEFILPIVPVPSLKVIVLEGKGSVDTLEYHNRTGKQVYSYADEWEEAYSLMDRSLKRGDWNGVGDASIKSALIQQRILPKPHLHEIIKCALDLGAYGINVAHSGTAVGIFMEERKDGTPIVNRLKEMGILDAYERYHITRMVKGGPRVL